MSDSTPRVPHDAPQIDGASTMGCGNPLALIELRPGQQVVCLGYHGGMDVLAAAQRVGPDGFVTGIDRSARMIELARRNAADTNVDNVEFLQAESDRLPLPDGSADAVLSSCVFDLELSTAEIFAEMARVLRSGGKLGIADVVAEESLSDQERTERGRHLNCGAGPMTRTQYLEQLGATGFADVKVEFTHAVADRIHGAMITATLG